MNQFSKYCLLLFIFLSLSVTAQQKEVPGDSLKTSYLDEVVVSANKSTELRRYVAQPIKVLAPEVFYSLNAQNTADFLSNTGLIAVQKSQQGGGSPVLRGFEASRVLLIVDGVRMNNLIYRAGHLQNVVTLDNNMVDRAEILFGPASTVYGSDALGGAIQFFSKQPKFINQTKAVSGNSFIRSGSANGEKTFHFDLNLAGEKVAAFTSFTVSDLGDLKMGKRINPALGEEFGLRQNYVVRAADNLSDQLVVNSDPYRQKFSGYRQTDLLQKISFRSSERVLHTVNLQYSTSTNVPRYDRLTDPGAGNSGLKYAVWNYGPQKRLLTYYKVQVEDLGKFADRMTATLSYQQIEESRHQRKFNNNNLQSRIEQVNVAALTIDFQKNNQSGEFRYGFDSQFNGLKSTAKATDITTGNIAALDTRYPGGDNRMNFMAAYLTHTYKINQRLTLNDGLRLGTSSLSAQFTDKTFFPFPFDDVKQKSMTGSASAGLIYTPDQWKISLLTSSGFRAPNIDDLAKVFESVAGSVDANGTLIVPNPNLKPEKSLNFNLGLLRSIGDRARIEGDFYLTRLYDAIVTLPFQLNGASVVTYDGTNADVLANQNKGKALIYGTSIQFRSDISDRWNMTAAYNLTKGKVINDGSADTPLDHIPPTFGRIGIQYAGSKFRGELFSNFSGWKKLSAYSSSGEDNLQYATSEGMPSWYTLNLRFSAELNRWLTAQTGVDNLMNLQYRTFASGINASGRNIFLTLRVKF
jgi:hemoglobin/transferrin/lactoferrin receptor protein